MTIPLTHRVARTHQIMVASFAALILILLAQTFAAAPENIESTAVKIATGLFIWLIKAIALLIFIPGFFRRSHSHSAWCSYVVLLYFVFAVKLLFTEGGNFWGWLMTISSLTLFISAMLFTRWQKQLDKQMEENLNKT